MRAANVAIVRAEKRRIASPVRRSRDALGVQAVFVRQRFAPCAVRVHAVDGNPVVRYVERAFAGRVDVGIDDARRRRAARRRRRTAAFAATPARPSAERSIARGAFDDGLRTFE